MLSLQFIRIKIRVPLDQKAAEWFLKKALRSFHVSKPRVITVDKNPAYPVAVEELKKEKSMPSSMQLRQKKYLNNIVEQDLNCLD